MEDGSNDAARASIELSTDGFSKEEVQFLIFRLKQDLNVESNIKKDRNNYKIYIRTKSYFKFIKIIKPHFKWDCFEYKIDSTKYSKLPQIGEYHSHAKLKNKEISEIFNLRKQGWLQKDIAKKYKISASAVSMILSGDRQIYSQKALPITRKPRLTRKQKEQILYLNNKGIFQKTIAQELNVNQSTVCRVLKRYKQGDINV